LRANEIMHHLEQEKVTEDSTHEKLQTAPKSNYQLSMFGVHDPQLELVKALFDKLDINTITPVEALLKLNELKLLLQDKSKEAIK
jgi:DNA mismatch repair protein MutS